MMDILSVAIAAEFADVMLHRYDGSMTQQQRSAVLQEFRSRRDRAVLLMSLK